MSLPTTHNVVTFHRDHAHKGRGAALNLEGRFELWSRKPFDDGWSNAIAESSEQAALKTVVSHETAKSILSSNDSPDIPFRTSVNPYRGCEHGCVYCFARPSHAYLGLSPGLDFETRLFAKTNAAALLQETFNRPSYRCEPIALGVNTDAYQPIERKLNLTRSLLTLMNECNHPVAIVTKSSLIERDIDILADMAARNLVSITITVTTLEHDIARLMEPRATAPMRRLQTIEKLARANIPVSINVAPVIPFLTDSEMENILREGAAAGAIRAGYILLRLPWELKPLFRNWLNTHFPLKAEHVMSRLNEMRAGEDSDPRFGSRMTGEGIFAKLLSQRFAKACDRFGLNEEGRALMMSLDTTRFKRPLLAGQGELF